jgi:hypothetical protein
MWHGRTDPAQNLDDWGSDGPTIGPLAYLHITYLSDYKTAYNDRQPGRSRMDAWFTTVEDLLYYDGTYYGDWTVTSEPDPGVRAEEFDQLAATPVGREIPRGPGNHIGKTLGCYDCDETFANEGELMLHQLHSKHGDFNN